MTKRSRRTRRWCLRQIEHNENTLGEITIDVKRWWRLLHKTGSPPFAYFLQICHANLNATPNLPRLFFLNDYKVRIEMHKGGMLIGISRLVFVLKCKAIDSVRDPFEVSHRSIRIVETLAPATAWPIRSTNILNYVYPALVQSRE